MYSCFCVCTLTVYVSGWETGKGRARFGTKCGELVAGWFVVTTRGRLEFSGDLFSSGFPANSLNISHIFHSFYMIPHLSLIDFAVLMFYEEGEIHSSSSCNFLQLLLIPSQT
jgi:hypothetical protein